MRPRREREAAGYVPYSAHVAPTVVKTANGDYLQAFRLGGVGFECADDAQLNNWHERLNVLWRNLASPHLALWTHVVRRAVRPPPPAGASTGGFAQHLSQRYQARLREQTLMVNELYLSVLYRPAVGRAVGLLARLLGRHGTAQGLRDERESLDACAKLAQGLQASLARYEPQPLGTYLANGRWYSTLLEYVALLINAEALRIPLAAAPLAGTLCCNRVLIGSEAIEYRTPSRTLAGAILGIKEYATPSVVGMYNRLLTAPFELILTQSFAFLSRAAGQGLLQRQHHRMANAGDFAVSQAMQLREALDALSSNEFALGDHHLSLQVLVPIGGAEDPARLQPLQESMALARSLLADTGLTVAREDLALEAAFWAQLPGNFALRPRKAPLTSRNFAAMTPFHNFPAGRAHDNHWGDALALLCTPARSPYYFSLHASDPHDPDGGSRKDTGHTLICGPTGSGKSVFIGFLVTLLARQQVTQVIFDKDRGLAILVRALNGAYFELRHGVATGFNPLQLPDAPAHVEFLKGWLRLLVGAGDGSALTSRESADLDQALRGTLALEAPARRLSRLIDFLDPTDPEGLYARLRPWCAAQGGDYAWAFDNSYDAIASGLGEQALIGFDVTEFLDHPVVRAPVTFYLFHLIRQLLDGRRLVCWLDEFWRLLGDPAFANFAKDGPKTWRKLNAVMCLATQSLSDVLESPISRTLIEQTPTKVLFPNPEADATEYLEGCGLTEREYRLLREQLEPGSRSFLVKQGHHSVVCRLDLQGCDAELAVISGRAQHLERLRTLLAVHGESPEGWLIPFMEAAQARGTKELTS